MSDDAKDWQWVGEDGAQKTLSEQELIAELSSESLPNYTLVWRRGWGEWLPAMQVAELAWALPAGKADETVKPKQQSTARTPPVPPLYRYPVIKRRAQNLKPDRPAPERPGSDRAAPEKPGRVKAPRAPTPPDGAITADAGVASSPAPPSPPIHTPSVSSGQHVGELDSDALDPREFDSEPAATDPAFQAPAPLPEPDEDLDAVEPDEEIVEVEADLEESRPDATGADPGHAGTYSYGEEDNAETRVLPGRGTGSEATYVAPHAPPPAGTPSEFPRLPPPPAAPSGFSDFSAERPDRRWHTYAYGIAAGCAVLVAAIFLLGGDEEPEAVERAAAPAGSAKGARPVSSAVATTVRREIACSITREPVKLAESAHPGVMPTFAPVPQTSRVAVGFGDGGDAFGITVEPQTLDQDEVFRRAGRQRVVTTAPTTDADKLSFEVVRSGKTVSPAAVVNAGPSFVVGWYEGHLARRAVGDSASKPTVLWRDVGKEITSPRVTSLSGTGHAVTLRTGGKRGQIRVGWLTSGGSKLSELSVVETEAELVGTPDIGTNADGARVAFAARKPGDEVWQVQTAVVERGGDAAPATWFSVPDGGPGHNVISPLIAGLPDNHWLLAWTEGPAGSREVRIQTLDEHGKAAGPVVRVSPPEENAGQGAIYAQGANAVVLFFVEGKDHHELWGTSVSCTPSPL